VNTGPELSRPIH
jgi:hypothetical protein